MRNIYYHIIDFKDIYPVKFWVILFSITTISILALGLLLFLLNRRNKNNKAHTSYSNNNEEAFVKPKSTFLTTKNILIIILSINVGLAIGVISTEVSFNTTNVPENENISVSSSKYIFGIDISHYQGKINWTELRTSHHPIEFIVIRATMGTNSKDKYFSRNWKNAKKHNYIRGAYHYYRPNENSTKQFENFASTVNLKVGDFTPVLDIEKASRYGSKNLRSGILNWLKLAEKKYKVKPVIYTGRTFYKKYLKGYVEDYPLWIASYSGKHKLKGINWTFHQFSERIRVKGIRSTVDGNDFNGEINDLKNMCIK